MRLYCDEIEQKQNILVPVKQVKHPTREGNLGISWYDFIDFAFYGVPDDLEVNMEPKRIWRLMARNFVNEFEDFNVTRQKSTTSIGGR